MAVAMKPVSRRFELQSDPGSTINVRQVRTGDLVHLGNLFSDQTHEWEEQEVGRVRMTRKWNFEELKRERVYVTLVGCDIVSEETNEPIFKFREGKRGPELDMTPAQFYAVWGALPVEITDEIYNYVLVVNPVFGNPKAQGE